MNMYSLLPTTNGITNSGHLGLTMRRGAPTREFKESHESVQIGMAILEWPGPWNGQEHLQTTIMVSILWPYWVGLAHWKGPCRSEK